MIELLQPWMLLGLLAALLPLWLHLRGRRKAPVVAFSALRFVLARDPQRARALRLRERLLVALRMAVVAGVAIALAGPMLPSCGATPALSGDGSAALVLVLDDSMSMSAQQRDGVSLFGRARDRAIELLSALPAGAQAAVVLSAAPARALQPHLSADARSLAREVALLTPRPAADDAERALTLAARLLAEDPDGRVVVLSDLQRAGWGAVKGRAVTRHRVDVEPLVAAALDNTAIVAARAEPASERGAREVRLVITIAHVGPRPFDGVLTIRVGPRETRRRVVVRPGSRQVVELLVGAVADFAELSLPGGDDIAGDDTRQVRLGGDAALRIGLVNGAPRPVPREDEVAFLRKALEVGASGIGEVAIDAIGVGDVDAVRLNRLDVVVLANVAELAPALLAALVERVEAGLGVVISVGDEARNAAELGWLAGLLPGTFEAAQPGPAQPGASVVDEDAPAEPVARALRQRLRGIDAALAELQVRRRIGVVPRPNIDAQVALRAGDGAPLLLATSRGRGRLLVWTSTFDLDWCDVALQPGFVALAAALASVAAGAAADRPSATLLPGQPFDLPRREAARRLRIRDQAGADVLDLVAPEGALSRPRWRVPGLPAPGRYEAVELGDAGVLSRAALLAVPPASESSDARLPALVIGARAPDRGGDEAAPRRPTVPAAPFALLTLLALLVAEGVLLARGRVAARGRP